MSTSVEEGCPLLTYPESYTSLSRLQICGHPLSTYQDIRHIEQYPHLLLDSRGETCRIEFLGPSLEGPLNRKNYDKRRIDS